MITKLNKEFDDRVKGFLGQFKYENVAVRCYALALFATICFENGEYGVIDYLDKSGLTRFLGENEGYTNASERFYPSVVEVGEYITFMREDCGKIERGEISKDDAKRANWSYFMDYISEVKYEKLNDSK